MSCSASCAHCDWESDPLPIADVLALMRQHNLKHMVAPGEVEALQQPDTTSSNSSQCPIIPTTTNITQQQTVSSPEVQVVASTEAIAPAKLMAPSTANNS